MKRLLLALIVAASLMSSPRGVEAQERPVDLIVLLDASQSMFPYFTDVVDFVVSRIAREYLRFGDTFHLLTFTDSVQIEIAQAVHTEQDLKSLLGRLYLLYPLGKNTDLVSALNSLYRYTADLPESNRKLIIMVTDGMHNPSPDSPYASLNTEEVRARIDDITARIRENGWTIRIVRVPFNGTGAAGAPGAPEPAAGAGEARPSTAGAPSGESVSEAMGDSPGAGDYLSDVATGLGAPVTDFTFDGREDAAIKSVEIPRAGFPGYLGKVGYDFSFPLTLSNPSSRSLRLELTGAYSGGHNLLSQSVFTDIQAGAERTVQIPLSLPDQTPSGETKLMIELRFADGIRVVPTTGLLAFELVHKPFARIFRTTGRIILFLSLLIVVLALIAALALYVNRLHKRAEAPVVNAVMDSEAASAAERRAALARAKSERPEYSKEEAPAPRGMEAKRLTREEALAFQEDIQKKHVTREEARVFQEDTLPKHVTPEEARVFQEKGNPITDEEAKAFSARQASITPEEAARYRDESAKSAAEALAAYAESVSTNRPISKSEASQRVPFNLEVKRTGSLRVEFRVEDQNPYIGLRNVRTLHSGGKKTVGGKSSDFLVFLLPIPAHVAEVYFDGEDLTLLPRRPEFFPDYDGPVYNCLNREIHMVSRHGKPLTLSFRPYVPPVDRINRLLHCVDTPGFAAKESESSDQDAV